MVQLSYNKNGFANEIANPFLNDIMYTIAFPAQVSRKL